MGQSEMNREHLQDSWEYYGEKHYYETNQGPFLREFEQRCKSKDPHDDLVMREEWGPGCGKTWALLTIAKYLLENYSGETIVYIGATSQCGDRFLKKLVDILDKSIVTVYNDSRIKCGSNEIRCAPCNSLDRLRGYTPTTILIDLALRDCPEKLIEYKLFFWDLGLGLKLIEMKRPIPDYRVMVVGNDGKPY